MPFPRRLIAAVPTAAVLLLAGCSGAPATSSSASAGRAATPSTASTAAALSCASSGDASDAVTVTGGGSSAPKVTFDTPTTATATERTVLSAGSGTAAKEGDSVTVAYSIYDGRDGKEISVAGWDGKSLLTVPVGSAEYLTGLSQSLVCTKEGERFAAVIPASAAFGDQGQESLGIEAGDSLVLVAKVTGVTAVLDRADGTAKSLPSGFPKVTLAADGAPTIAIPSATAPKALRIADSKVGDGEAVESGDTVTVHYTGVLWRNGKTFDSSWSRGEPASFSTDGVVPGFSKALVGQKVGSQVVAIIPPSEGYGEKGSGDIKGTDTMVFVIDVLATSHTG